GPSLGLDALIVAVSNTCDGKGWFTSTLDLQLVSLQLCVACRSVPSLKLMVRSGTPWRLWLGGVKTPGAKKTNMSRLPTLRAREVCWNLPVEYISGALENVKCLTFDDCLTESVDDVAWPVSLEQLTMGTHFNKRVDGVWFPASLQRLTFGSYFNQRIDEACWPVSLQRLVFGYDFNQAIDHVRWPESLQRLVFGHDFNQAIDQTCWPASLQQLVFGDDFNQALERVS
ncbi:unnamed protein product, partial [Ectocarpus fasciculatus]